MSTTHPLPVASTTKGQPVKSTPTNSLSYPRVPWTEGRLQSGPISAASTNLSLPRWRHHHPSLPPGAARAATQSFPCSDMHPHTRTHKNGHAVITRNVPVHHDIPSLPHYLLLQEGSGRTLTVDTRAATDADREAEAFWMLFIFAGATNPLNAPTRGALVAVRPVIAATRAELADTNATTMLIDQNVLGTR